ncbi:MAG: translocation/assembly module TamB domain-containing protein [Bacteroidetes bacterium]|nr:translocation/assembly module TamB domain-containing protein [Bacteroidota bacterium]
MDPIEEKEGKVTKKSFKKVHLIVDVVFLLSLLFYMVFRLSGVQTYLSQELASYLSTELKTEVSIGSVDISWFLNIELDDLKINDRRHHPIIDAKVVVVDLSKIYRFKRIIKFSKIKLNNADIRMVRYSGDHAWNYDFLIDYFSSSPSATKPSKPSKPWSLIVNGVSLKSCRFLLQDQNSDTISKGICYSNLRIKDINLNISGLKTVKDTVFGDIKMLSAKEHCGFELKEFKAKAKLSSRFLETKNLHFITNRSNINMDLRFDYRNFAAYDNFLDSIDIHSQIRPSKLEMEDIAFFAPDLKGMVDLLDIDGEVSGKVNNLRAKDFTFKYGDNTHFNGNITMTGLPNIQETFVHLSARMLKTSMADLHKINLPAGVKLPIKPEYDYIGNISIKGFFTGFYNDFVTYADFKTGVGNFSTDISVKRNESPIYITYKGKLEGQNIDAGKIGDAKQYLGKLNMNLQIEGKGVDLKNLDANLTGTIDSLEFKGNKIDRIDLKGGFKKKSFTGLAKVRDDLINLDFDGKVDLHDQLPVFDFTAWLRNAKLTQLNLIDRDTSATLSAHMNLNFKGSNIDNLLGKLEFDSTLYIEKGKMLPLNSFVLQTKALKSGDKQVLLRSDYLDGDLTGMYSFQRFYSSLNLILNKYLPSFRIFRAVNPHDQFPQDFFYYFTIKDPERLTSIFVPTLKLSNNSIIKGSFSVPNRALVINGDSKSVVYKGIHYHDFYLNGHTSENRLYLNTGASKVVFKENKKGDSQSLGLDSVSMLATVAGDSIKYRLRWNDTGIVDHNIGDINGYAAFRSPTRLNLGITKGSLMVNDSVWTIHPANSISIDSTNISIENLAFTGKHERLLLQGTVSKDPSQKLNIIFQQFDISSFDKFLNVDGVDIDGVADGTVSLTNLYDSPNIFANLNILGLKYNKDKLGDAAIISSWNDIEKAFLIDMHVIDRSNPGVGEPLSCTGTFHPYQEKDNFDLKVSLNSLNLHVLSPFLSSFTSSFNGKATGNVELLGDTNYPFLKGVVYCKNTSLKINYLNTRYSFDDKITLDKDVFKFSNITIKDTLGKTGILNGEVRHKAFSNWFIDLNVEANKLTGFNKGYSYDEMYYGTAVASGNVKIYGPTSNLNFSIKNARTDAGTNITIPLNNPGTVSDNDFISFVNKSDSSQLLKDQLPVTYSGLSMNMDVDVTNDATIQLFLPYEMGKIKVNGNGKMNIGLNNIGEFSMMGDYHISNGTFLFTMPKYSMSREFSIMDDSYIRWSGSPYDATINLRAVTKKNSIKVSLATLPNATLNTTQSSQRIPVDCIISLKDNLFKPKIKFSISLPDAEESIKRLVFSAIDTTNEVEMNQQMISLLMVGSFSLYNETTSLASSLGASPYAMFTNQLNNTLSQISKDFDIGVNYRPGDNLTSQEVEVMLSTQLFNNRVKIDGNVGVSSNNPNIQQRSSNLVGDVNIEVRLTPDGRFKLRFYNKSNNRDIIDVYAPYKQGAGLFYRKEFDHFGDLFRRQKKKMKVIQ